MRAEPPVAAQGLAAVRVEPQELVLHVLQEQEPAWVQVPELGQAEPQGQQVSAAAWEPELLALAVVEAWVAVLEREQPAAGFLRQHRPKGRPGQMQRKRASNCPPK